MQLCLQVFPASFAPQFRRVREKRVLHVKSEEVREILLSKKWIKLDDPAALKLQDWLFVETERFMQNADSKGDLIDVSVTGTIFRFKVKGLQKPTLQTAADKIGSISFQAGNVHGDVVEQFLLRHSRPLDEPVFFSTGGYRCAPLHHVNAPKDCYAYAVSSGDFNPIHTNRPFATMANLSEPIVHGMWSSANARKVVEMYAASGQPSRVHFFEASFSGMVFPNERVTTELKHVGVRNGQQLVDVRCTTENGGTILKGHAQVEEVRTGYVFTGQGSAEVGMGMDLYKSSQVAKQIWDEADLYFVQNYGFSIIEIVTSNPKHLVIHFGGMKGAEIKRRYQALTCQAQVTDELTGNVASKQMPLFPSVGPSTSKIEFKHPDGLLFATQFSQPSLVLVELAAFHDMRAHGLIPDDCLFCGHSLGE
jgi:acyl dehydratase